MMFRSALGLTAFATLLMPAAAGAETITYHAALSGVSKCRQTRPQAPEPPRPRVLIPIMGPLGSPIKGMAKLTDAEIADFAAGSVYVNIHTEKNPDGEIRLLQSPGPRVSLSLTLALYWI
ncbi:CHRD domain-containing protein [Dongia soli]|uniref:CHRD domain-containing protein n=1 Tax=Dongia soli TaxID=600628 RepID=A0ABU5EE25_9PROT|nr:CHRD domain-containing protein [Dongia soli]MDY0884468.1 CHRD domain-containing protein [Dongia soli]